MTERSVHRILGALILAVSGTHPGAQLNAWPAARKPATHRLEASPNSDFGKLPLAFEPNVGQTGASVRFLSRGGGMTTFFTDTETVMVIGRRRQWKRPASGRDEEPSPGEFKQAVVRMKLEGSQGPRSITGEDKLPGVSNYFIGNDPSRWRTDVPHYARIEYAGVYPGIDAVWYGNQGRLEYDFVVGAGADPNQIQVSYEGAEPLQVESTGDLLIRTALGEIRQPAPKVYQEIRGQRVNVAARYTLAASNRVTFTLAHYDRKYALRIDPVVLSYSTFLGGTGIDAAQAIAVDAAGSAYVTGFTASSNFPIAAPFQVSIGGANNAFVTKLAPAGNALVYSTYLGGNNQDEAAGIAVDSTGAAYVTGQTTSSNFPVSNAYQASLGGNQNQNAFVTKLAPAGNALVYSTYLGGNSLDSAFAIAVDSSGSAYVTGGTISADFPTVLPYQAAIRGPGGNAFVTKFTPAGNALAYSTFLGGSGGAKGGDSGFGIAVDAAGSAYITGNTASTDFPTFLAFQPTFGGVTDAFVTKLSPGGNALVYSTYLGGSEIDEAGSSGEDAGNGIAVDATGSAYVTGYTGSSDFPTAEPLEGFKGDQEAFVTKFTPAGNALIYSTYLGGTGGDSGQAIAVDGAGSAYVAGNTSSVDFPNAGSLIGLTDAFVAKLTPAGTALEYANDIGGSLGYQPGYGTSDANGVAVDTNGSAYVTGYTQAADFPVLSAYQGSLAGFRANYTTDDAFVTKLSSAAAAPVVTVTDTPAGPGGAFFFQGQNGVTYTATVTNGPSTKATNGTVTVTENIPTGLSLVSMVGTGWSCVSNTCSRSDVLAPGASYPSITVTVNVASNATTMNNSITVSGGGSVSEATAGKTNILPYEPLLSAAKTHVGNFTQGEKNVTYMVTVSNATGAAPSSGTVMLEEYPPAALSIVSMSGSGWSCSTTACTRGDVLNGGTSYPPITVTANVAAAAVSGTNYVAVIGSSLPAYGDATTILPVPAVWSITKTHSGTFQQGQNGAAYTVTVSNIASAGSSSGTVTVTENPPAGLSLVSMAGIGWSCPSNTCTRSDTLTSGASYPPITATVNVASSAPAQVINQVTVAGGGAAGSASASDTTNVTCALTVSPISPAVSGTAGALTLTLGSQACGWTATSNASWLTTPRRPEPAPH